MKKITRFLLTLSVPVAAMALGSCESGGPLFDDEGDCTTKVQFIFKKHRQALQQIPGKESDVFYATVPSVHLFVYDKESGQLVLDRYEKTENLYSQSDLNIGSGTDKCLMPIDLPAGKYKIVAWCGLDESDNNNAFSLVNGTKAQYSHALIKTNPMTGHPVNEDKYQGLYHGKVEQVEVTVSSMGSQVIPVELTKNTNDISVWVQHTTATFEDGDYYVVYTDKNGTLKFEDNQLDNDKLLEYHPHTTSILTSDAEYNGAQVKTGALIAHLSTSRLMSNNDDQAKLEVRDKNGKTVYSIPFIKYLKNMQTFTDNHQYYLDCEDTYNCTFYLTGANQSPDGTWMPLQIIINNWVMVPEQNGSITGND